MLKGRIVVIDDEPLLCASLKRSLSDLGSHVDVKVFEKPKEAVEYVRMNPTDAVVVDIMMPGMKGHEAARQMRSDNPLLQFIVITGHPEYEFVGNFIEMGIHEILLKPFDNAFLIDILVQALERSERLKTILMKRV